MDSLVKIYLERAENEFRFAKVAFNLSGSEEFKIKLGANKRDTFYSSVISHCYYAIFYSAKALLLSRGIKTKIPNEHKKTYEEFKKNFVDSGKMDKTLLKIYGDLIIKADELLSLFAYEKRKRGNFTYKTISQANKEPAKESLGNALLFFKNINVIIEKNE